MMSLWTMKGKKKHGSMI